MKPRTDLPRTEGLLRAEDLTYEIPSGRRLVDAVSLSVSAGETVGLVGPNGSGKTTLLRCVYGALRPTGGRVLLDGDDLADAGAKARARRIATVPQDGQAGFELTVRQIVAMGRSPHKRFWEADTAADEELVRGALERVGAADLVGRSFARLSGGERQRVLTARALVQEPAVLVLDEPTNHLDIRYQLEILGLVRGLGTANLLALHDLTLAAYYCDRLYVLDAGRVVASGPPKDVLTGELLAEVYGVAAEVAVHPATGAPTVTYLPGRIGAPLPGQIGEPGPQGAIRP
ncbi:ABC transporter ATP-binding protein [Streptomyces aurantiacus]|uniref:Putative Cobalamin import ATP-binding protein BtuD n=1 Tax=Streptomyces aurantiacus JA 4570 TaxID=1286094 RepID=S3ZS16_9ACTN|nr:ABC transporter ATP-binding protein [Streptomyces aurantiacus]EPH46196.1 putative Cobalamin import ATP-binding protein BtuD [Streptomyces aurantiacus JA 4570]